MHFPGLLCRQQLGLSFSAPLARRWNQPFQPRHQFHVLSGITPSQPVPRAAACRALLSPCHFDVVHFKNVSPSMPPAVAVVAFSQDLEKSSTLALVGGDHSGAREHSVHATSFAIREKQTDVLQAHDVQRELRMLVRLLAAVIVGGIIGVERRAAKSLAGIRTFSLVSLGAAIFMSTAIVGCPGSDPIRASAAISTSVGFLGAGALQQGKTNRKGMTTAAGIWLAASLGICCAVGMYITAAAGALAVVLISRYCKFDSSLHRIPRNTDRPWEAADLDGDSYLRLNRAYEASVEEDISKLGAAAREYRARYKLHRNNDEGPHK